MDSAPPTASLCLYKETCVGLDPFYPNSIIQIQLPSTHALTRISHAQRQILSRDPHCKDEDDFRKRHIARSGSTYFCKNRKYPRSFVWRCSNEDHVLELQAVDLSKGELATKEATNIVRLVFPNAIRHNGIALADTVEQDILHLFVLTKSHDLYTFTLRPDVFCRPAASEDDIDRWYKIFKPASLILSSPHRLFACGPNELMVALGDGRLMRLTRRSGDDGSKWLERTFGDGQWGSSLRGLIRWQGNNTVRYDGNILDQDTVIALAPSPTNSHTFAVCLNHTIKAWNNQTGKITFSRDLQGKHREPQEIPRIMLNPSAPGMLQLFEARGVKDGDQYYIATFSPNDSGIFKFLAVRDADYSESGIRDLFPDKTLKLPDPNDGALWTLADFKIKSADGGQGLEIWCLMRLNRRCMLYNRKLDLLNLSEDWQHNWSSTDIDSPKRASFNEPPSKGSDQDFEDVNEQWLRFLFTPGRLPDKVFETALSIFHQTGDPHVQENSKAALKTRVAFSVANRAQFQTRSVGSAISTDYRNNIYNEWVSFWSIANALEQSRWEPLSLGYDEYANLPWILFADGCSVGRECSQTELLVQNKSLDLNKNLNLLIAPSIEMTNAESEPPLPDELALLIEAAAEFRAGFSEALRVSCKNTIRVELWQESSFSVPVRLQSFYDRCNFVEEVGDRQYNDLEAALGDIGGFGGLDTASFKAILDRLPQLMSTEDSGLVSTKFGLSVLVKGAYDLIALHTRILTDLLLLVVFVDMEVDREETPMPNFDAAQIYTHLLSQLRPYQMMQWLATKVRPEPMNPEGSTSASGHAPTANGLSRLPTRHSTVLENLFAVDPKPRSYLDQPETAALTYNIEDLLKWVTGGNDASITLDQVLVHIQCNLLKNNNIDLASSFLQFQPSTAWSTYIKGRLHLLRSDFIEAAICFKQAAYKLCKPSYVYKFPPFHHSSKSNTFPARPAQPPTSYSTASSHLLTPLAASYLSTGPANYNSHILSLFEALHAHAHVITFARLALQYATIPDQRADLLTRLFSASFTLQDWDTAYSTLIRYSDTALQRAALAQLVTGMLEQGEGEKIMALPWLGLTAEVDTFLAAKTQQNIDSATTAMVGGIPWYKLLHAYRTKRGDFRGAASVLMAQLEARKTLPSTGTSDGLKAAHAKPRPMGSAAKKTGEKVLLDEYLVLINALAVVGNGTGNGKDRDSEEEGWVFVGGSGEKRKVITLGDARALYQEELDRRSVLESGRWGIVGE